MHIPWRRVDGVSYTVQMLDDSIHLLIKTEGHRIAAFDVDQKAVKLLETPPDNPVHVKSILRNVLWQAEAVERRDGGNVSAVFKRAYRRSFYMHCQHCDKTTLHEQSATQEEARCLRCFGEAVSLIRTRCPSCQKHTRHGEYGRTLTVCVECDNIRRA